MKINRHKNLQPAAATAASRRREADAAEAEQRSRRARRPRPGRVVPESGSKPSPRGNEHDRGVVPGDEDERVKSLAAKDSAWLKDLRGRAIKIVAPLLGALPADLPVKIIFMEREPEEVIASQKAMLERNGKTGTLLSDGKLVGAYAAHLAAVNRLAATRPNIEVLPVSFADAVHRPEAVAPRVAAFLQEHISLTTDKMASVSEKSLHRNRTSAAQTARS